MLKAMSLSVLHDSKAFDTDWIAYCCMSSSISTTSNFTPDIYITALKLGYLGYFVWRQERSGFGMGWGALHIFGNLYGFFMGLVVLWLDFGFYGISGEFYSLDKFLFLLKILIKYKGIDDSVMHNFIFISDIKRIIICLRIRIDLLIFYSLIIY